MYIITDPIRTPVAVLDSVLLLR